MQNKTPTKIYECSVFEKGHIMQFDPAASGTDKSVYSCSCGATIVENEDAGTGV